MTNAFQSVQEQLLQMTVEKMVSEALGGLVHKLTDFTEEMEQAQKKEARNIILRMMRVAAEHFINRLEARNEKSV